MSYTHDLLFNIYGIFAHFRSDDMAEKVQELLRRTEEGMDQASHLRALDNRHRLMELRQRNSIWQPHGGYSAIQRTVEKISWVHPRRSGSQGISLCMPACSV